MLNVQPSPRTVASRNTKFKAATSAQKRVMIAQDVIERINSQQLKAVNGHWLIVDAVGSANINGSDDMQEHILKNSIQCRGCAMGGIMLSCVAFNNTCSIQDVNDINLDEIVLGEKKDRAQFLRIFGKGLLTKIEVAFEGGHGAFDTDGRSTFAVAEYRGDRTGKLKPYAKFGKRFRSSKSRLIAIMENIISNKGDLVVTA